MPQEELEEIKKEKADLRKRFKNSDLSKDDFYVRMMNLQDDEIVIRINNFDDELGDAAVFKKNKHEDIMHTMGTMQRYNTELAKARQNRHKAKRYMEKVYGEKFEYYKLGKGQVQLKSQREYDVYIGKDGRYSQTASYCESYDILIKLLEEAIKQLHTKIFAIQSMLKSEHYDTGPSY